MRILIGEISSYKAIVIARYLRLHYPQAKIIAYDHKPLIASCHTRYADTCIALPFRSIEDYIQQLAEYVRAASIDVFIPVHSDYIGAILQQKHLFGGALDYLGRYEDYIRLHQKNQLQEIALSLGIRMPHKYDTAEEAKVPFVVKPSNLSSAKGVHYYRTEEEKNSLVALPSHTICQEYVEGQGCGYEVYCREGQILVEYGHMRLAEWPISGGSSVLRQAYMHPDMRTIAEKILSRVPWTGFAMFEFKLTRDNQLVLIEVNPRIWGSINQALQDGCPLFEPILGTPTVQKDVENVRTCLSPQVELAIMAYVLKGRKDVLTDYWTHRKQTRNDVSFWTDPKGLISMIIRKLL